MNIICTIHEQLFFCQASCSAQMCTPNGSVLRLYYSESDLSARHPGMNNYSLTPTKYVGPIHSISGTNPLAFMGRSQILFFPNTCICVKFLYIFPLYKISIRPL